jgi:hypothetical protein
MAGGRGGLGFCSVFPGVFLHLFCDKQIKALRSESGTINRGWMVFWMQRNGFRCHFSHHSDHSGILPSINTVVSAAHSDRAIFAGEASYISELRICLTRQSRNQKG